MYLSPFTIVVPISKKRSFLFSCLSGSSRVVENSFLNHSLFLKSINHEENFLMKEEFVTNDIYKQYALQNGLLRKLAYSHSAIPPTFVIIPSFQCNLKCVYCYESLFDGGMVISKEMCNAIDLFVKNVFLSRQKTKKAPTFIFMGGEPLLPIHDKVVLHFIDVVKAYNGKLQIITNGTFFNDYSEKFKDLNTVIQITLDGPPEINTFRRPNKKSSNYMFNNILLSIENYLKIGLSVCVRVNVDWHNIVFITGLVEILSKFEKYNGKFEIYFYPVSEGTSSWSKYFITEIEYATEMSKLSMDFPKLLEYNWSLHGCDQIYAHFLDKQSVGPSFSFCSASGNQFVFAPDGKVYSCWWGIGKKDFQIGLYFPTTRINDTLVKKWGSRTIINKQLRCYSCRFAFICGGSCTYKAWEAFGDIFATKCPLIEDLINIYVKALYR